MPKNSSPTKTADIPKDAPTKEAPDSTPEPQLRWTQIPHDGPGTVHAAPLPDGLGALVRAGDGSLIHVPGADVVDGRIVRHEQSNILQASQVKQARENAPVPTPTQIAQSVKEKEEAFFLQNQRTFEAKNAQPDPGTLPQVASMATRSQFAPKLPEGSPATANQANASNEQQAATPPAVPAAPVVPASSHGTDAVKAGDGTVFGSGQFRMG